MNVKKSSKYTTMNKAILEEMDNHIITSMRTNRAYTPAGGYTEFCERYAHILHVETERLKLVERLSEDAITKKIKKTYKNRYFMLSKMNENENEDEDANEDDDEDANAEESENED